jgi:hypothetical protein
MKLPSFYAELFFTSLLLSFLLWGLFIPEVFVRVFFEYGQKHVLVPMIFISFLISLSYFSLHTFVLNAYKKLRETWILSVLIIIWYIISLLILEFIAQATQNFGNTMNCLGAGCVTLVMMGYQDLSWIFLPVYWAAIIALFKNQLGREIKNSSQKI